jgi:hypothetical protein
LAGALEVALLFLGATAAAFFLGLFLFSRRGGEEELLVI